MYMKKQRHAASSTPIGLLTLEASSSTYVNYASSGDEDVLNQVAAMFRTHSTLSW